MSSYNYRSINVLLLVAVFVTPISAMSQVDLEQLRSDGILAVLSVHSEYCMNSPEFFEECYGITVQQCLDFTESSANQCAENEGDFSPRQGIPYLGKA